FFCHLFAVGVYGLGLLAFEMNRLWQGWSRLRAQGADAIRAGLPSLIADFVVSGLPFAPVLPLLMLSPTWGLRQTVTWELDGKIDGLIYVIEVYSHATAFVLTAVIAFAMGWALRHRALGFHRFGLVLLAIGAV